MAERGAHLTATSQAKPSIFEVVAQDSLTSTIHPAFKRICVFLASCNPERYGWLASWFDEAYLILNSVAQYHYLKYHGSSFAEHFYGLQRVPLRGAATGVRLPLKEERLSLLCLTLLPYLHSKIENLAIKFRLEEVDGVTDEVWSQRSRQLIMKIHAILHMTWEGAILAQYLSYMSGNSENHSPLLRLAQVTLKYNEEQDDFQWTNVWGQFLKGDFSLPELSGKLVGNVLTRSFECGAFFLQFLQWWNAEQSSTRLTALPIPEPQREIVKCMQTYVLFACKPEKSRPLCQFLGKCDWTDLWNRTNKACDSELIAGINMYVFCYRCIVGHLKKNKYCPVTKYPATAEDLIRIYSSES